MLCFPQLCMYTWYHLITKYTMSVLLNVDNTVSYLKVTDIFLSLFVYLKSWDTNTSVDLVTDVSKILRNSAHGLFAAEVYWNNTHKFPSTWQAVILPYTCKEVDY